MITNNPYHPLVVGIGFYPHEALIKRGASWGSDDAGDDKGIAQTKVRNAESPLGRFLKSYISVPSLLLGIGAAKGLLLAGRRLQDAEDQDTLVLAAIPAFLIGSSLGATLRYFNIL